MVRRRDRIIALIIAIAFFGTSFALSFAVIWQLYKDNKEAKTVNQQNSTQDKPQQLLKGTKLSGFTPMDKVDSLQKIDLTVGDGKEVKQGDNVTVNYTGALVADGTIFESSLDTGQPVTFTIKSPGLIQGWVDGIPGMKEGGKRRLIIPADKAYGANPREGSGIPPNAALVFDVTLISVGQ